MKAIGLFFICIVIVGSGCAFQRDRVAGLSQSEDQYYSKMQTLLTANRQRFSTDLTMLLQDNLQRQRLQLEWERNLAKYDVLLRSGTETKGGQTALLTEAAASDLTTVQQVVALQNIDKARLTALLNLYDGVIKAAAALQTNNQVVTRYLQSNDETYAIKSLDVRALAAAITDLQDLRNQLNGAQAMAAAAKTANEQNLEKNIEKAQNYLLEGLTATKSK